MEGVEINAREVGKYSETNHGGRQLFGTQEWFLHYILYL